jgi:hypothetical protein
MTRGWLLRLRLKNELRFLMRLEGLEHLVMSANELKFHNARRVIEKPLKVVLKRIRRKFLEREMAIKIQKIYRGYSTR